MSDDLIRDNEVTREALKRLPKDVYQERQWRLTRSIAANANKAVIPESDWLKITEVITY